MKEYLVELKIRVWLLGGEIDYGTIRVSTKAKNGYNAILSIIKFDWSLEKIKIIRKHSIKYDWENDWDKAFDYEVEEIESVSKVEK